MKKLWFICVLLAVSPICFAQGLKAADMLAIMQCPDSNCISAKLSSIKATQPHASGYALKMDEKGFVFNYIVDDKAVADLLVKDFKKHGFEYVSTTGTGADNSITEYKSGKYPGIVLNLYTGTGGKRPSPIYDFELWKSIWEVKK